MNIHFHKYQGAGNDFIMVDNRDMSFPKDAVLIEKMCHRRWGIGADGLILLESDNEFSFRMEYYNSDGKQSTMCGNGGRCIVAFARYLNVFSHDRVSFRAIDGMHQARIEGDKVYLKMQDVVDISEVSGGYFTHTGSPHHVVFSNDISVLDVMKKGAEIRYGVYQTEGANVNFVQIAGENRLKVRTYERGVENETYSCGTGAIASAVVSYHTKKIGQSPVFIETLGGALQVSFEYKEGKYSEVWLNAEAVRVFEGVYES